MDTSNWKYKELREFIDKLTTQEDHMLEWKSLFDMETDRIRKLFAALANKNGGYIFWGISNDKTIIGIGINHSLKEDINRKISVLSPPVPPENWDIVNCIAIPESDKFVYIVEVRPSHYTLKPHMCEEKVYLRENGENKAIRDGVRIRDLLLTDRFQPEHIRLLEYELNKIKQYKYTPDFLDIIYLLQLKQYLESRWDSNEGYKCLSDEFYKVIKLVEKIQRENSAAIVKGEQLSIQESHSVIDACKELSFALTTFIYKYREIHRL